MKRRATLQAVRSVDLQRQGDGSDAPWERWVVRELSDSDNAARHLPALRDFSGLSGSVLWPSQTDRAGSEPKDTV